MPFQTLKCHYDRKKQMARELMQKWREIRFKMENNNLDEKDIENPQNGEDQISLDEQTFQSNDNAVETDDIISNELEKISVELSDAKDKYLRLYAEFDNYRKRTMKESLELRKVATQELMVSLLSVMDDFERAKKAADDGVDAPFSDGVNLVFQKLTSTLHSKGLKIMESTGQSFDPECHEAITEIPAGSEDMVGKIIDTVEKGYYLNDKIIRYAKVVVGK